MRVQRAQPAQEILGKSDVVMITERVDDVALRIGPMVTMGFPEVLDRPIPRHWTPRGSSWGGTAVIWLASLLTEGAHRNGAVATSRTGMPHPRSRLTAQGIAPLDVRDDRLRHRLPHLRPPASGHQIAHDVHARSLEVHDLLQEVIRGDATTVSGEHEVPADGL
jgi:hypothetical protein